MLRGSARRTADGRTNLDGTVGVLLGVD